MYIESYWVYIAAIWIIYLIYRTGVWSKRVQELTNQYEELLSSCAVKKYNRTKDLVYVILKFNQDVLKKAPKRIRDKVLADEAEQILNTIYNYNTDNYDDVSWIVINELFCSHTVLLPPSKDIGRDRLDLDRTKPYLVKRLNELMDENLSYLK